MTWTIHHGEALTLLRAMPSDSCDVTITDPPYSEATHAGARTGNTKGGTVRAGMGKLVTFPSIAFDDLRAILAECGRASRRWVLGTMEWRHVAALEANPPDGLRFVRFGVWVKTNGTPQFTGDRPGQGWEGIAILHRLGGAMTWAGGGRTAVWSGPLTFANGPDLYPTQKPLWLARDFVWLFANGSGPVLDPFCGAATIGAACVEAGIPYIGIDRDADAVAIARERLGNATRQGRMFTEPKATQAGLDL